MNAELGASYVQDGASVCLFDRGGDYAIQGSVIVMVGSAQIFGMITFNPAAHGGDHLALLKEFIGKLKEEGAKNGG